jgi:hypothetical protein
MPIYAAKDGGVDIIQYYYRFDNQYTNGNYSNSNIETWLGFGPQLIGPPVKGSENMSLMIHKVPFTGFLNFDNVHVNRIASNVINNPISPM